MIQFRSVHAPLSRVVLLTLLAGTGVAVQAQESSPYYLGASQSFVRDNNILRQTDAKSDTISSTGVRAGIDQAFGRQRAVVGLEANRNRYSNYNLYNNTDYAATGRLDWSTVERMSGTLSAESRRSLYRNNLDQSTAKNLLTTSGAALQVQVGLVTRWSFDTTLSTNRQSYSASSGSNLRQNGVGAGVRFRPSEALSLRTGLRRTEGKYPNVLPTPDDFTREDLDFDSQLEASGASRLSTRLSYTRESHSLVNRRAYHGWTGSLGWNWRPTGKLTLDLTAARDSNVGSQNAFGLSTSDGSGDTRISNTLGLRSAWELSPKLGVTAGLGYARRTLDNAFLLGISSSGAVLADGKDSTKSANLGVRYMPLRNLDLGCGVNWEDRSVQASGLSNISFPYSATSYNCSAQIYLR